MRGDSTLCAGRVVGIFIRPPQPTQLVGVAAQVLGKLPRPQVGAHLDCAALRPTYSSTTLHSIRDKHRRKCKIVEKDHRFFLGRYSRLTGEKCKNNTSPDRIEPWIIVRLNIVRSDRRRVMKLLQIRIVRVHQPSNPTKLI